MGRAQLQRDLEVQVQEKKRKKEVVAAVPSKVLILVGKNTQLIRDYVLNELKDEHNLNIQRVSML